MIFDQGNRVTRRSYNNNTFSEYAYDANSRITRIAHSLNDNYGFNYAYDNSGNRIAEEKTFQPLSSRQFIYDDLNRLTTSRSGALAGNIISNPISEVQFNLDGLGNRLSVVQGGDITNYTTNELNQYTNLVNGENISLVYEDNGNLISDGTYVYSFDYENRLVKVDNGAIAEYQFDALGRRIRKIVNSDTTSFYYDKLRVIEERTNGDVLSATYVYGLEMDEVVKLHRNGQHYYYHEDALGSITQVSNSTGEIVEQIEYDAFGKPSFFDGNYAPLNSSAIENPYLFTGRRYDGETGLHFYRSRYYSDQLGRFLQRDPLDFVDGFSVYNYVKGSPANWVDPLGLASSPCDEPLWDSPLDDFQTALDLAGLIPVFGEPFDLVNAGIYYLRGDELNAGLSLLAMVPVGGQAATGGKLGLKYGDELVQGGSRFFDDAIEGGAGKIGQKFGDDLPAENISGFRYMAKAELKAIQNSGPINDKNIGFLRGGDPGEIFFTKDLYKSGEKAQRRLSLDKKPELRVEFEVLNNPSLLRNGTKVRPLHRHNKPTLPGKGAEFMTNDPVQVRIKNWQPLR